MTKFRAGLLAAGLCMLGLGQTVSLAAQEPAAATDPSDAKVFAALAKLPRDASLETRMEAVNKLIASSDLTPLTRGKLQCTRGNLFQNMGKLTQAADAYQECLRWMPDEPRLLLGLVDLYQELNNSAQAARYMLDYVAASATPDPHVDPAFIQSLSRQLQYDDKNDLDLKLSAALVKKSWFREEDPVYFSSLAYNAMLLDMGRGDTEAALAMLPEITSPDTGVLLLADRRFQPIWPQVERWAGNDMAAQRKATLETAKAAYAKNPTAENRLAYLSAMQETGERKQAIEEYSIWLAERGGALNAYERSRAAVKRGSALAEDGQQEAAIKAMTQALGGLPRAGQFNIVPNLVVQLILADRNKQAMDFLDEYAPVKGELEAPAAFAYFMALRACALHGLGKASEAKIIGMQVGKEYSSNKGANDIASACLDDDAQKAAHLIAALKDPYQRGDAIRRLEEARYRMAHHMPAVTLRDAAARQVYARPDVRQAFDKVARMLPAAFEPALNNFVEPTH